MYKKSTNLLRAKILRKCAIRGASVASSLDKKILSFLENDAEESLVKQCSEMKKTPTLQVISKILKSTKNEAGILVPICSIHNRPSILFTVRARHLNSHAGEIRFVLIMPFFVLSVEREDFIMLHNCIPCNCGAL